MKPDAYTKALLTLIVVCLIILCVLHMKSARATEGALAFSVGDTVKGAEAVTRVELKEQSGSSRSLLTQPQRPVVNIWIKKESDG